MTSSTVVQNSKRKLRAQISDVKMEFSVQIRRLSDRIAEKVIRLPEFVRGHTIGLYASEANEVQTRPIFEAIQKKGSVAIFPAVEKGKLTFRSIRRWEDLKPGFAGILEPVWGRAYFGSNVDLLLVPGVAFDLKKNRLGRGGGYYDRWLANPADRPRVLLGLAFEFQLVDSIPTRSNDVPMDVVVTEERVIR